jgi:hypothetical protein
MILLYRSGVKRLRTTCPIENGSRNVSVSMATETYFRSRLWIYRLVTHSESTQLTVIQRVVNPVGCRPHSSGKKTHGPGNLQSPLSRFSSNPQKSNGDPSTAFWKRFDSEVSPGLNPGEVASIGRRCRDRSSFTCLGEKNSMCFPFSYRVLGPKIKTQTNVGTRNLV